MFDLALDGAQLREIASQLTGRGIPSSSGAARWSPTTIREILAKRVYTGSATAYQYRLGAFLAAWRERVARQTEEQRKFQRDTLLDLQDTLEVFFRATYALHLWRESPERFEELQQSLQQSLRNAGLEPLAAPPVFDVQAHAKELVDEGHLTTWTDTRFRLQKLASRVDNTLIRDEIAHLVEATRSILTEPMMDAAQRINALLNEQIGLLVRHGQVTKTGFVAPDQTKRRKLL